jgi:ABC-type transport system substrate-binding protein
MKKSVPVMLLGLLLASCGNGGSAIERDADTVTLRLESNPTTLNPVSATDLLQQPGIRVFSIR